MTSSNQIPSKESSGTKIEPHHLPLSTAPTSVEQEKIKDSAQKAFQDLEKDKIDHFMNGWTGKVIKSLERGWKVVTTFISDLYSRISSLFRENVTETKVPKVQSIAEKILLEKEEKPSTAPTETPRTQEKPIEGEQAAIQPKEEIALAKTQEKKIETSRFDDLFHTVKDLQEKSTKLKFETTDDIKKAQTLANEWKACQQKLDALSEALTKLEKREKAVLAQMLKVTASNIYLSVSDLRLFLIRLFASSEEEKSECDNFRQEAQIFQRLPRRRSNLRSINHIDASLPVGLINAGRNACYRNSVNQALLMPFFELFQIGKDESGVGTALKTVWDYQKKENPNAFSLWISDEILLDKLKASNLMPDLTLGHRYEQQEAAAYLQTLLDDVFGYKTTWETTRRGVHEGKTISSVRSETSSPLLHVPVAKTLEEGVNDFLHETVNDPANAWKPEVNNVPVTISESKIDRKINDKPQEVVAINVKRRIYDVTSGRYKMDYTPMMLSDGNSLDLSDAYGMPANSVSYQLKSFVWFQLGGELERGRSSGHYIAYVNKDGAWYEYNDESVTKIDELADARKAEEFKKRLQQFVVGIFVKTPSS